MQGVSCEVRTETSTSVIDNLHIYLYNSDELIDLPKLRLLFVLKAWLKGQSWPVSMQNAC